MIDPKPVLLVTALALGGCDLTSKAATESGSASAFSGNGSAPGTTGDRATASAALTNAELARLIGTKIGAALNDDDRRFAYEAQIKALESGSPGAPVPWRNPVSGRYGNIVPGPAYDRKGANAGVIPIR